MSKTLFDIDKIIFNSLETQRQTIAVEQSIFGTVKQKLPIEARAVSEMNLVE